MARIIFLKIKSDPSQIDRFLAPLKDTMKNVDTILVAHSHYDHLMDMPYIAKIWATNATIYGSETMTHILASALPSERLKSLNHAAGSFARPGKWFYVDGGRIRFMALGSEHAPHFLGIKFFKGEYSADLKELPQKASEWLEGKTFTFLIDFMGEGPKKEAEFRIFYQDAASNPPSGFPPPFARTGDQKRIDLAILCVAGFEQVRNYPESIIQRLSPRFVVLVHWEDFFRPLPSDPKDIQTVAGLDIEEFVGRLRRVMPSDAKFEMPFPGAWLQFVP